MSFFSDDQIIGRLEKRKGGYFFVVVPASAVADFPKGRLTRLLCALDGSLTFQCGLNHLGDGNFFIILSGKNLKTLGKGEGDALHFELSEDPDPLGVTVPEALAALLAQDEELAAAYGKLSLGKQRHIVHSVARLKNLDKQIATACDLIGVHSKPRKKKASSR